MSFKKTRLGNMKYVLEISYMISSVAERQGWTLQQKIVMIIMRYSLEFKCQLLTLPPSTFVKSIRRRNGDIYFCAHCYLPALQKKNNLLTLTNVVCKRWLAQKTLNRPTGEWSFSLNIRSSNHNWLEYFLKEYSYLTYTCVFTRHFFSKN